MASINIIFNNQEQGTHELSRPKMVVGREPTCDIVIDNLGISRQHCAFINKGEAFVVQDMGSANGTFVNAKKITEHFLNDGDEVVIGKFILRFKNDIQAKQVQGRDSGSPVPDTLNTYVMDGAKIQEQLQRMRQQTGQPAPGAPAGAPPPGGATAKDYARAMEMPPQGGMPPQQQVPGGPPLYAPGQMPPQQGGGNSGLIIALVVILILVLAGVGVALYFFLNKSS